MGRSFKSARESNLFDDDEMSAGFASALRVTDEYLRVVSSLNSVTLKALKGICRSGPGAPPVTIRFKRLPSSGLAGSIAANLEYDRGVEEKMSALSILLSRSRWRFLERFERKCGESAATSKVLGPDSDLPTTVIPSKLS